MTTKFPTGKGVELIVDLSQPTPKQSREMQCEAEEGFVCPCASSVCTAIRAKRSRALAKPIEYVRAIFTFPLSRCGCGRHSIPFGADPYAEHREWMTRNAHELLVEGTVDCARVLSAAVMARGVGISAPPRLRPPAVEIQHEDFV